MDEYSFLLEEISGGDPVTLLLIIAGLLAFSGVVFFVLAGCAGYLTTILTIAASAYPVARAKAAGIPWIQGEILDDLIDAGSHAEALGKIQADSGMVLRNTGDGMEQQLEEEELDQYRTLLSSLPPDFIPFFEAYGLRHEIRMIKRMIRMHHHGSGPDETEEKITPAGIITAELAARFATGTTMDDALQVFRGTTYEFLLTEPLLQYHQTDTILPLEIALDTFGAERVQHAGALIRTPLAAPFRDYAGTLIDLQNLRTLIRAKHAAIEPSFIGHCLPDGGRRIPGWRLLQLNEMMTVPDLVSQLAGTGYDQVLQPALAGYPDLSTLVGFDLALDRFLLGELGRISQIYPFTGGPLIRFMVGKEYGFRNLQVILTGLAEKVSPDDIRALLVSERRAA